MAAEIEKIIVQPDPGNLQDVGPDLGHKCLDAGDRRFIVLLPGLVR